MAFLSLYLRLALYFTSYNRIMEILPMAVLLFVCVVVLLVIVIVNCSPQGPIRLALWPFCWNLVLGANRLVYEGGFQEFGGSFFLYGQPISLKAVAHVSLMVFILLSCCASQVLYSLANMPSHHLVDYKVSNMTTVIREPGDKPILTIFSPVYNESVVFLTWILVPEGWIKMCTKFVRAVLSVLSVAVREFLFGKYAMMILTFFLRELLYFRPRGQGALCIVLFLLPVYGYVSFTLYLSYISWTVLDFFSGHYELWGFCRIVLSISVVFVSAFITLL